MPRTAERWSCCSSLPLAAGLAAQAPTFQQISTHIEAGLDALGRGDTAAYLARTPAPWPWRRPSLRWRTITPGRLRSAAAVTRPPRCSSAWHAGGGGRVRSGSRQRVQPPGWRPAWRAIAARIGEARKPISHSIPAFELAERDLTAEGTAWDAKTGRVFLGSLYKRKIVAIVRTALPAISSPAVRTASARWWGSRWIRGGARSGPRAWCCPRPAFRWPIPPTPATDCCSTTTWTPAGCAGATSSPRRAGSGTASTTSRSCPTATCT